MNNIGKYNSEDADAAWNWDGVLYVSRYEMRVALTFADGQLIAIPCSSTEEAKKLYKTWLEMFTKHCGYDND